jgi:surfactin synthase thioesterase subunit
MPWAEAAEGATAAMEAAARVTRAIFRNILVLHVCGANAPVTPIRRGFNAVVSDDFYEHAFSYGLKRRRVFHKAAPRIRHA